MWEHFDWQVVQAVVLGEFCLEAVMQISLLEEFARKSWLQSQNEKTKKSQAPLWN